MKKKVFYSDHNRSDEVMVFDSKNEKLKKYEKIVDEIKNEYDFEYAYFTTIINCFFVCIFNDSKNSDNDIWKLIQFEEVITPSSGGGTITLDNFDEEESFDNEFKIIKADTLNYQNLIQSYIEILKRNTESIGKKREIEKTI
jgi:hypothetical protein